MTSFKPTQKELRILIEALESWAYLRPRDREVALRMARVLKYWVEETEDEERERTAGYTKVQDRQRRERPVELPEGEPGLREDEAVPVVPRETQQTLGLD